MLIDVITSSDNNEHCKTQISHHDFSFIFGAMHWKYRKDSTHLRLSVEILFFIAKMYSIIFNYKSDKLVGPFEKVITDKSA